MLCVFLLCRWQWLCALLLCRELKIVSCVEFLCKGNENFSCGEGMDVEKVAWISKQILLIGNEKFFYLCQLNSTFVYILYFYYCSFIHPWYWSCAYTWFDPRKLLKHLNSYKREILRRSFGTLHREFGFTLWDLFVY